GETGLIIRESTSRLGNAAIVTNKSFEVFEAFGDEWIIGRTAMTQDGRSNQRGDTGPGGGCIAAVGGLSLGPKIVNSLAHRLFVGFGIDNGHVLSREI